MSAVKAEDELVESFIRVVLEQCDETPQHPIDLFTALEDFSLEQPQLDPQMLRRVAKIGLNRLVKDGYLKIEVLQTAILLVPVK